MPNPPVPQVLDALFRMLESRLDLDAVGLIRADDAGSVLVAGTPALLRLWPAAKVAARPPDAAGAVNPGSWGLPRGFTAIWPLGPPWALLLRARSPRGFSRTIESALRDAAVLIAPHLDALPAPEPPAATTAPAPPPGETLSRTAAHAVIDAAIRTGIEGEAADLALLVIGIDRFRSINEALGIAAGDALLAEIGARIERALTSADRLARLEGARFLIVTRSGPSQIDRQAARLLDVIRQPIALAGTHLSPRASIGVAAARTLDPRLTAPTLLERADNAMRRAKAEGTRVAFHEPARDPATLEASQLEIDLANAPANGQLYLSFQPFIDLSGGEIAGAEALMRWRHPTRGEVRPGTFIPLAESTGLILPLGLWALRSACRSALDWPGQVTLAVNISALQFHQPGFVAQVERVLAETGFPAARLELEITETVLMRDDAETLAQLRALISGGIRIALDDFGTGYSALAYLSRLPHHRIKLDKSFVGDLANPATAELIRAIVAQARANGVGVTAEGVERPEQIAEVRAMGFTHAQGYATGLPLPEPVLIRAPRLVHGAP